LLRLLVVFISCRLSFYKKKISWSSWSFIKIYFLCKLDFNNSLLCGNVGIAKWNHYGGKSWY